MANKKLLLLPLFCFVMVACNLSSTPEATALPTAVAQPTMTASPPATNIPTAQPTLPPEPTVTISPTPDPTPTPEDSITEPEINYELQIITAESLHPDDDTIKMMNNILDGTRSTLPPPFMAARIMEQQIQPLTFQNGSGIRALTVTGQNFGLIHKGLVYYEFQGLTNDRRYYVVLRALVDHPLLIDPQDNQSGLPLWPTNEDEDEAVASYNSQIKAELENQPPDSFMPSLTLLDELVNSLLVERD
jgi:hypothetical protein